MTPNLQIRDRILLNFTIYPLCFLLLGWPLSPLLVNAQATTWETLNSDGMLAFRQKQYDQAKSLFLQALASTPEQTMPDARMATTLNNLGATHKALGEYEQAKLRYQHSLALVEAIQGPTHPDVAVGLNNLAALHLDHGVYDQAEILWARGLKIYEKHLGLDHPHLVPSLQTLALVTQMEEKFRQSEQYYKRTIQIIESSLGHEHGRLIPILEQYAHLLRITEREAEADIMENHAASIRSRPSEPVQ
ncbi:MAG: tetratricopeptide repeat protein [Nitrospirota bacterium]|nr:tetratricopeptide repeat protein [Nitrospirota bacterium]